LPADLLTKLSIAPYFLHNRSIIILRYVGLISKDKMNKDDLELSFAKDEVRKDYKLGKILATSAIASGDPLGPIRPKRTKLKLFILVLILDRHYPRPYP